jgi:glutathione S-transferase
MIWISIFGLGALGLVGWWALEKTRRKTHPVPAGYQADLEFPHEQEFELYHNALSLCSMKSRVCMAELGIPYKSHPIDLIETGCYENIRPRLLSVNPGGTVPVLLHNGHPIYESHEQIRYAARFAPAGRPSLIPDDPIAKAEMEEWIDLSSLTEDPIHNADKTAGNAVPGQTLPLFCTMIEKIPYHRILEGLLFHFDKMRPVLFLVLKFRGIENIHKLPPAVEAIAKTREHLRRQLGPLESRLEKSGGPWILGEQYTLADVSWLVIFERLRQASCEEVFLDVEDRTQIAEYWKRLQARPAYAEAILGHSHPLIEHGRRRIAEVKATSPAVRVCLEGA